MANEHVETSNKNLKSHAGCDPTSTSDADAMADTLEFKLLKAYATRRRRAESPDRDRAVVQNGKADANGGPSPPTPAQAETEVTEEKTKKKKGLKGVFSLLRCINPQTKDEEPVLQIMTRQDDDSDSCYDDEAKEEEELEDVADELIKIADEIPFIPPTIESDAPDDDVERLIGLLLREAGDKLNERELKDFSIARELFWNYSFFQTLVTTLLTRMGLRSSNPDSPGPHASPKTQIAVACEATSRLSRIDTLPMNRLLGYGARYLTEHYSSWVQQQGGYEAAFESNDEDDVQ